MHSRKKKYVCNVCVCACCVGVNVESRICHPTRHTAHASSVVWSMNKKYAWGPSECMLRLLVYYRRSSIFLIFYSAKLVHNKCTI